MAVDSIESLPTPQPPEQVEISDISTVREAMNGVYNWSRNVAKYHEDLYLILHSGALVRSFQVEELLAGTIGAGTISVDQIYLGSSKFELDGVLGQIRILDDAAVVMVEIGEFGGGSDWGIKVRNGSNAVVFSALSNAGTTMDGAIITNSTLVNAQIVDVAGNKLTGSGFISATDISVTSLSSISANFGTITAGTINATVAINAGAINAGTFTADGSPLAIVVTGSGACQFKTGGDIELWSQASDTSTLYFMNSSGAEKANMGYHQTSNYLWLESMVDYLVTVAGDIIIGTTGSSNDITLQAFSDSINIGNSSLDDINPLGDIANHLTPSADDTYTLASSAADAWADIWCTNAVTVGDLVFANGMTLTEPNKVFSGADPNDGIILMRQDWTIVYWDHVDGTRQTSGFPFVDVPKKLPMQSAREIELMDEFFDELDFENNMLGYKKLNREIHEWVIEARDNNVELTDTDVETKKQECLVKYAQGNYEKEIAKADSLIQREIKIENKRLKREERKDRRKGNTNRYKDKA